MVFFPEGTRSEDGKLRRFKKGAFVTAIEAGVPVIPVAINGSHRVQSRRSIRVRGGTIRVVVGEPLPTDGLRREDRNALLERAREARTQEEVHEAISDMLAELKASHCAMVEGDVYQQHFKSEFDGELAPMFGFTIVKLPATLPSGEESDEIDPYRCSTKVVAGARYQRYLHLTFSRIPRLSPDQVSAAIPPIF